MMLSNDRWEDSLEAASARFGGSNDEGTVRSVCTRHWLHRAAMSQMYKKKTLRTASQDPAV